MIETSPSEGTTVRKGSTVTLVVSRGKEKVAVPDVVGKTREEAQRALREADLESAVTEREDQDAEPGTVLEQDPAAGTRVAKGRTVELVVAKAPADVPVPGVIDATEEDAMRALEDAGFEVTVEDAAGRDARRGRDRGRPGPRPGHAAAARLGGDDHGRPLRARRGAGCDRHAGGGAVRVAVLHGGRSSEHDVSLASAQSVDRRRGGRRARGRARPARARRELARARWSGAQPGPRRRPARGRRRLPRAARAVRRGRDRAGPARAARRALRRRGGARLVALHGQDRVQGRAGGGRRAAGRLRRRARGALARRAGRGARRARPAGPAAVRQAGAAGLVGRDRQGA